MDTDKVIQDLNRRFAASLPEFYQRRIIFWYDEDKEFEDKLEKYQARDQTPVKAIQKCTCPCKLYEPAKRDSRNNGVSGNVSQKLAFKREK